MVEAQHKISTVKLTDTAAEQSLLDHLIEETKPNIPPECQHLNYLLSTPFRYGASYPRGSRFRRAGRTPGIFYASEYVDTAVAELCFHRLLFFAESPDTRWPGDAGEFTAFAAEYATFRAIDLMQGPFQDRQAIWMHPTQYEECQQLADLARATEIQLIRYASVRDPHHRPNIALLSCQAFNRAEPVDYQSWHILFGSNGARALCERPKGSVDFNRDTFAADPRIAALRWDR
jgi:RES domain